jgi:predicted ATP-grasp superfamily ATP-dependent carboligase
MPTTPAVVLSGHIMALGVVRSLGAAGIPSIVVRYRHDDLAHASRHVIRDIRVPHPEQDPAGFVRALMRLGPDLEGSPLIPASDETVVVTSRHKDELGRWFKVACPDGPIAERIIHKEHTYALADEIGVAAPRTQLVGSEQDLERHRDRFTFPCLAKPSQSHLYQDHFGRKMVRVENMDELREACREAAEMGFEMLLQELIPGDDRQGVNYNSLRLPGAEPVEFTAAKIRLAPRAFGPPAVVVSRDLPEIVEPARRLLAALGYEGYSCVEFKRDTRDGVYKLMEVNGRFNLSSLLMLRAGINFPSLVYRHLTTGELPSPARQTNDIHWISGTKDIAYGIPELVRRPWSLRAFMEPYARRHVFAVFDRTDPRPSVVRYGHLVRRGVALVGERLAGLVGRRREPAP